MDDYLDSFQNRDDALKLGRDLISLLKLGGIRLTTALDPDNRESNSSVKDICASPDQSSHVLGLMWDHVQDTLVVSRRVDRPLDKAITQRTLLSFVSSVFDPIGLVAPYTVEARLLLKDIWRISGQKWDDDLPEEIKKQFLEWHSGLHLLGSLTIPRSYFTEPFDQIELHMFGDSSQDVFCAVAFLRARLVSSYQTELACVWQSPRRAYEIAFYSKVRASSGSSCNPLKRRNFEKISLSKLRIFSCGQIVPLFSSGFTVVNYSFLLVIALVRFWSLPPLISGITYLAVITQLIPVHEGFLRKPSRKAAGLMTLVY